MRTRAYEDTYIAVVRTRQHTSAYVELKRHLAQVFMRTRAYEDTYIAVVRTHM
jgi:hypothetical protein